MQKVYIPLTIDSVIKGLWKDHSQLERSVIGRVDEIDGKMVVTDIYIPKQKNSKAYTEMDDPSLDGLFDYLIENERADEGPRWRLRLHSHNTMQPFRSGQDDSNRMHLVTTLFKNNTTNKGRALSIVIGAGAKYHATLDYYLPETEKRYSIDVEVISGMFDEIDGPSDEAIESFVQKYKEKIPTPESFEGIPVSLRQAIAEGLGTEQEVEGAKKKYIEAYKSYMFSTLNETEDERLIAEGLIPHRDWDVQAFIDDLKEKEKQPLPVYKSEDKRWNKGHTIYNNYSKKNKKKNKSNRYYTPEYEEVIETEDDITYRTLQEAGWVYSPHKLMYRDPETGEYMTFAGARKTERERMNSCSDGIEEEDDTYESYCEYTGCDTNPILPLY